MFTDKNEGNLTSCANKVNNKTHQNDNKSFILQYNNDNNLQPGSFNIGLFSRRYNIRTRIVGGQ